MTFRVVGIGASAGGLEAVSELLGALPAGTGMACIVVQHLDPHHESLLPEILAKTAAVPVTLALDAEVVQPDHVYIIPPNTTLTVAEERFHLTTRPAFEHHLPVDALFRSLAVEYARGRDRRRAVRRRLRWLARHPGHQARGRHRFRAETRLRAVPEMPRHAIETGCVDRVLSPSEIAHELVASEPATLTRSAAPQLAWRHARREPTAMRRS